MPEWPTIWIFVAATTIVVCMPGPNTLYIMTRSLQQGVAAGVVSSFGVMVGTLIHISAAALGLSALLLSSALAFSLVKFAGAAYLIYLGITTLLSKEKVQAGPEQVLNKTLGSTFRQGIVVNVLNPKTALFFTAFLPQFISLERGSIAGQIFFFGGILVLIGAISDITYSILAGKAGRYLQGHLRFLQARRYIAGGVYLGLGAATALTGGNKT
jgi:threonine/homoserine/homoserine lactone efflux protein